MEDRKQAKQIKTAQELEAMILEDLSKVDGCPKGEVTVTVYGLLAASPRVTRFLTFYLLSDILLNGPRAELSG
jgi:hypothetical protein